MDSSYKGNWVNPSPILDVTKVLNPNIFNFSRSLGWATIWMAHGMERSSLLDASLRGSKKGPKTGDNISTGKRSSFSRSLLDSKRNVLPYGQAKAAPGGLEILNQTPQSTGSKYSREEGNDSARGEAASGFPSSQGRKGFSKADTGPGQYGDGLTDVAKGLLALL
ncbi:KLHL5 [Symbiodinium sp. KB8]|nr:KLHL5 [Symbiodinium sp. KB8]